MDPTLQRHCARYIYAVPDGLPELMSDISREVLRAQPEDMYTFIADYLDALLITRENARVSAKFVEDMTEASETVVNLLQKTGMSRTQADATAEIIQHSFKAWSERKGILKEDDEVVVARIIEEAGLSEGQVQTAAVVIQTAFKQYKQRQQRESKLLSGVIDWRVAARSAIKLYRKCGVSPEEAKRAANLIKTAYKGYYTRRAMRVLNEPASEDELYVEEEEESTDTASGDQRKGVRIDYQTVVPHVDFAGEDFISRDEEPEPGDELAGPSKTDEEFISDILLDIVENITGPDEETQLPVLEDRDEVIDDFIPTFESSDQPSYTKAPPLEMVTEEELEMELQAVKEEAEGLQHRA